MFEEKIKQLVEAMLLKTGPIVRLNDFNKYSGLPAPQTVRNKMKDLPENVFLKQGRTTMVDMQTYLPIWASQLKPYGQGEI